MKTPKMYSSDPFYKQLWSNLARDFRTLTGDPMLYRDQEFNLRTDISEFRDQDWDKCYLTSPLRFKCKYQLETLLKRYKFENDKYSMDELESKTTDSFLATQLRISTARPVTTRSYAVIQRARKIAKSILGKYDPEEHFNACRFGKRASKGCPNAHSYLDEKLGYPLTGTRDHITWFSKALLGDEILPNAIASCVPMVYPRYKECDTLSLVNVPKSFKSLRSISPNTIIGGFYSYGLGKVIQTRLTGEGLNIRYLQKKHGHLAKLFSRNLTHATADLSAASDSFTPQLVNKLLPRQWYNAVKLGRIQNIDILNSTAHMVSFMTMGIGFTFQLQTLLFYCILKSIQSFSNVRGFISVYGDDLIYPSRMHKYVTGVFEDIGFILNSDKTFVKENFRESCGSDFYCGYDVRPFQPEGASTSRTARSFLPLLYKTINGLLRRWDKFEIPITYKWLIQEIIGVSSKGVVYQVPPSFPDYSGLKVDYPSRASWYAYPKCTWQKPWMFECLGQNQKKRTVWWQFPFYWDTLRQKGSRDASDSWNPFETDTENLSWVRRDVKTWRSSVTGRRYNYRLVAMVSEKSSRESFSHQTSSTVTWC